MCPTIGAALRYCVVPSPKKPAASLDASPVLWAVGREHPPLWESVHEPLTAQALRARRQRREAQAAEQGEAEPRVTELDIWPIVVHHGFRNGPDQQTAHMELAVFAMQHCSLRVQQWLFKNRVRLPALIDDIWQWENMEENLCAARLGRMDTLRRAAQSPCVCNGAWAAKVVASFIINGINVRHICTDVCRSLTMGRGETVPVLVLAGARGGEGKSLFLKALLSVYGHEHVFQPPENSSFPLLDLPGKKVAFLDEWRFDDETLSFKTQCLWYDGSAVPVARPQNQAGVTGHALYRGSAPLFATTKLSDIQALAAAAADDPTTGRPKDAEASMLLRRLKIYSFTRRLPSVHNEPKIAFCGHCFSTLVLTQAIP